MVETRRAALSLEGSVPEPELHDYLERLASRYLEENGAELVELLLAGSPNRRMIRIYVDQPGGITIDRCATFSRGRRKS
jgi:ribosome maturation factor RimP